MSNPQEELSRLMGEIKASLRMRLVNAAVTGSMFRHCYQTGASNLLKSAIPNTTMTEEECCAHLEIAAELEQRIRAGKGLYVCLDSMIADGWLKRIDPDMGELLDECEE